VEHILCHVSQEYPLGKKSEGQILWPLAGQRSTVVSTGTVKWFNGSKGFGFITPDVAGEDLFVHHSEIKTTGYANLEQGQKVNFDVGQGKKGPCATNVIPG
jgi:CspA family cold shock protein